MEKEKKKFEKESLEIFRKNYAFLVTEMRKEIDYKNKKMKELNELFNTIETEYEFSENENVLPILEKIVYLVDDDDFSTAGIHARFSNIYKHLESILSLKKEIKQRGVGKK